MFERRKTVSDMLEKNLKKQIKCLEKLVKILTNENIHLEKIRNLQGALLDIKEKQLNFKGL